MDVPQGNGERRWPVALAIVLVLIVIPFLLSKHTCSPRIRNSSSLEQWRCAMAKNPQKTATKRVPESAKRGVAARGAGGGCGRRGAEWSHGRGRS